MFKAGMEPRNMTYQDLINHLVTLDVTDTINSQNKEGASGGNSKSKKGKKPGKGNPPYKNKSGNLKKGGLNNSIFVSFSSENQTPTKPTTIQNIKVGILFKKVWLW